jgi:hypothetical protein
MMVPSPGPGAARSTRDAGPGEVRVRLGCASRTGWTRFDITDTAGAPLGHIEKRGSESPLWYVVAGGGGLVAVADSVEQAAAAIAEAAR